MKLRSLSLLLTLCLALASTQSVYALKSDRDKPADIEADDIEFDFKKGTRIYTNNVIAVQGTLRIKADKLIAKYEKSELTSATAWGSLARFKSRPDGKEHDVEGWAKKIIVNQQANTLTLVGRAALKQGGDTARGEEIVYNMANDTLKVKGGARMGSGGNPSKDVTKPQRKLEDPFKDDKPAVTQSGDKKPQQSTPAKQKPEYAQTPSGRSRLIIQPKPKKEGKDSKEDKQDKE